MNKLCFFDRKRKFIRAFNRSQAHEPAGFLVLSSTNKKHRQSGACLMVACLHETCTKDTNIFQGSRKVLQSKSFLGKGATLVSGTVFVVRQKLANGAELRRGGGAKGIRTPDLLNAIQTRYQLRYNPILIQLCSEADFTTPPMNAIAARRGNLSAPMPFCTYVQSFASLAHPR